MVKDIKDIYDRLGTIDIQIQILYEIFRDKHLFTAEELHAATTKVLQEKKFRYKEA